MGAPLPDIAAFKEAQARLRQQLGVDAHFKIHTAAAIYAPGVQLDPETHRPYDPTIQPTTPATVEVRTHKVMVVVRIPNARADETKMNWSGLRSGDIVMIALDLAAAADVESATEVQIKGINFTIGEMKEDPGLDDRVMATLEMK